MKRFIFLFLLPTFAFSQVQVKISQLPPASTLSGSEQFPFVQNLTTVQTQLSVIDAYFNAHIPAFNGDCSSLSQVLTCTKTSGVPFAPSATVDATNASNIVSGTLNSSLLPAFSGDIATATGSSVATIQPGSVSVSKMANLPGITILGNASAVASTPSALNPLAVGVMMGAVYSVNVVATANITLSGVQTIDSIALAAGQTVLVAGQTTLSQNGIYVVQSGAWTQLQGWTTGYVLAQNCNVSVYVAQGSIYRGTHFTLNTSGGAITIGTTAQSWAVSGGVQLNSGAVGSIPYQNTGTSLLVGDASLTWSGTTLNMGSGAGLVSISATPASTTTGNGSPYSIAAGNGGTTSGNGGRAQILAGTATDGNGGDVRLLASAGATLTATARNGGNVQLTPGLGASGGVNGVVLGQGPVQLTLGSYAAPTVSAGAAAAGSTMNRGQITGLSAVTSVTLTYTSAALAAGQACVANTSTATPVAVSATAISTTAVTFSFAAAYTGSLYYVCF